MSDEGKFAPTQNEVDDSTYTNQDVEKEDRLVGESEKTGTVSKDEVEGLKDSIGGGEVLDESEGYTRSSNQEAKNIQEAEDDLDAQVEAAE